MVYTLHPILALMIVIYVPFMVFFAVKARHNMSKASAKSRKKSPCSIPNSNRPFPAYA